VLDGDRLHRREARNEWPKHHAGEFQARAERREDVEAHRLAREHVLEGAPGDALARTLSRLSSIERFRQHEVAPLVRCFLGEEVPVASMGDVEHAGAVLPLPRFSTCPIGRALRVDRTEFRIHG